LPSLLARPITHTEEKPNPYASNPFHCPPSLMRFDFSGSQPSPTERGNTSRSDQFMSAHSLAQRFVAMGSTPRLGLESLFRRAAWVCCSIWSTLSDFFLQ
jgi:hypothetical protein